MRLINDSKINLGHSPALQCLDRSHLNGFRPIGHSVVRLDYADVRQAKVVKGLNRLISQCNSIEIGRASCRERVCQYVELSVVAVSLTTKKTKITCSSRSY